METWASPLSPLLQHN